VTDRLGFVTNLLVVAKWALLSFAPLAIASRLLLLDSPASAGSNLPCQSNLPSPWQVTFFSEVFENKLFALRKK
jgi:hypothetical protein